MKRNRISVTCIICGIEYFVIPYRFKNGAKFCSKSCEGKNKTVNINVRFWDKVQKTENCWIWIGGISELGYGQFDTRSKYRFAHRFSYFLHFGEIPKGLKVCHKCDNRKCVNPEHLFLGTQADNIEDAKRKNRMSKGVDRPLAKLAEADIVEIRKLYKSKVKQNKIAKIFAVTSSTVWAIVHDKTWCHVIL